MKITDVSIENYKSISKLHFKPNEGLNAFIGENSAGKSNILNAIYWLLGPVYPSFNSTQTEDRYLGNLDNKIKIQLTFDDGKTLELAEEWRDHRGEIKIGLNLGGGYIKDEVRKEYCSGFLGVDRQINDYMPSNKWSLVGRILQQINEQFKSESLEDGTLKSDKLKDELKRVRDELLFSVKDADGNETMKKFITILQEESAKQLNKLPSEFKVDLNLYDPWNFYRTLQILVHEPDTSLDFRASTLGMGMQASISIAVLKAYSEINLNNKTPIFIDEPELFLHPQAQRNFYRILRKLAESGTQVFYTTHSPNFLSAGHFDEIFLVCKPKDNGTNLLQAEVDRFIKDLKIRTNTDTDEQTLLTHYRNACDETGDSQKANEAFFANKIILVEGSSESLALPYLFDLFEFDYIKEGITIVRCGSKNELDRFYRLYSEFGIPCYVIFDGDRHLDSTSEKDVNIGKNRELFRLLNEDLNSDYPDGQVKDRYLGFEDEFEQTLGFTVPQDCKGLSLYLMIKRQITNKESIPYWIKDVVEKINALKRNNVKSCLLDSEPEMQSNEDMPF
ncbi:hypothetical protein B6D29_00405 [Microgenomates bacterium UTCPR1]|nr:MAG: hypothetical protein B6D29_00405 [Microgenomates bacterium UTCPR1]